MTAGSGGGVFNPPDAQSLLGTADVTAFGAKADARHATDGAITNGQFTVSSSALGLTSADALKAAVVAGAGVAGAPLITTVVSVAAGIATLNDAASATVSGADVTVGTDATAAFTAAHLTGRSVYVPKGAYLVAGEIVNGSSLPLRFQGDPGGGSTIYHPNSSRFMSAWGSVGADVNLAGNATINTSTLNVTTATFAAEDFLLLKSTANWDATYTGTVKKGEIVRVESITDATHLVTAGVLVDSYATADTAAVAKMNYLSGHHVTDLTFHNVTPDYGTSAGAGLNFRQCADGRIERCVFKHHVGSGINLFQCRAFDVTDCDFYDGSYVFGGTYGYGVTANGTTVDCTVTNCRGYRGHGALFTSSASNGDYGVPRYITVRDCEAAWFYHMPFHSHDQGEFLTYIACRAVQGSNAGASTAFVPGFGVYAKRSTLINCVVENSYGPGFSVKNGATGALLKGCVVRNQQKATSSAAQGFLVDAPGVTLKDCYVDGITDSAFADNTSGAGIVVTSAGTTCHVVDCTVKNTSGNSVSISDTTDTCIVDNLLSINAGLYSVYASYTPAGKWRNVRTVNSGTATTNQSAGLQSFTPQRAGVLAPSWGGDAPTVFNAVAPSAGRMYFCRFQAPRDIKITAISYPLAVNAGADDAVDVAILDAAYNRLASAGATTGKLNAGAGTWVSVTLSAPYVLRQGLIYYLALSTVTPFGGTAATLFSINSSSGIGDAFGTTAGLRDMAVQTGIGSTIGAGPFAPSATSQVPWLRAVEG